MAISRNQFIENDQTSWLDWPVILVTASSIIGYLSVRSWTNITVFLLLLPALTVFKCAWLRARAQKQITSALPLIITMVLPVLAILVSQIVRQEWSFKPYDGPSRILLCIPVLFYFLQIKLNFSKIVAFSAPIALLILIPVVYSHPETLERWIGRFATPAVDPTEFGTYSLVLTAFCLFGIETEPDKLNLKFLAYQISGFLAGIYLLLGSGTRGSWIAIPPLLVLWAVLNRKNLPPKILKHLGLLVLAGIVLICLVRPYTLDRVFSGIYELSSWLNGSNTETSAGLRLTMWQISWELFKHNPLQGYGDHNFKLYLDAPWISSFASIEARETILHNGPHNELLANLLRSGVMGGISVIGLFMVPLTVCWRNRDVEKSKYACRLGLAYITSLVLCSLSSEVLTFKYTSSFYGLVIAGISAQIISAQTQLSRD
ncbi:O-antigen ligase family protein [Methylomonas koyamae]|uniref:O-antigen ligase family protein n=1 Tax=Methylomonas koyamae TaxID=702114 RepID=UPI002872DAA3|nr:O-antigen ligase family protein [Methylomonas koyamae]WNB76502.1 O-antigen ligase family protein [Methylomonas koyamae]